MSAPGESPQAGINPLMDGKAAEEKAEAAALDSISRRGSSSSSGSNCTGRQWQQPLRWTAEAEGALVVVTAALEAAATVVLDCSNHDSCSFDRPTRWAQLGEVATRQPASSCPTLGSE